MIQGIFLLLRPGGSSRCGYLANHGRLHARILTFVTVAIPQAVPRYWAQNMPPWCHTSFTQALTVDHRSLALMGPITLGVLGRPTLAHPASFTQLRAV